jgi:hypothetical protein
MVFGDVQLPQILPTSRSFEVNFPGLSRSRANPTPFTMDSILYQHLWGASR